jgi:hypothetical protein
MDNYFSVLNGINVNGKTEKKGSLTYLSWSFAWGEVKKLFPDATYTIYENANGWNYHTDGKTCWVKTGVTVNGIEHIEYLPVMDNRNNSIKLDHVTSFDVNKAIQRSLTKAIGRHGLGLYIYAGEDLPETDKEDEEQKKDAARKQYEADIEAVKALLETVTDADTANQASHKLRELCTTADSERDGIILWNRHIKGLGLFYDRVLNAYTPKVRSDPDRIDYL